MNVFKQCHQHIQWDEDCMQMTTHHDKSPVTRYTEHINTCVGPFKHRYRFTFYIPHKRDIQTSKKAISDGLCQLRTQSQSSWWTRSI